MRHPVLVILLVVVSWMAAAQSTTISNQGRFQVDKIQGCAPFTVTIVDANVISTGECTPGSPCLMFYQGGQACAPGTSPCQNLMSYTYTTPGTYKLQVLYQSQTGAPDEITITVDQNIQPDFEIYRCSTDDVVIKVVDDNFEQYVINFADASPEVAVPFGNFTTQHNYTTAGTYNIGVRGRDSDPNAADNCTANFIPVQTLSSLPSGSITRLRATSNTGVQLEISAPQYILHRLEVATNNSTNFAFVKNVYNSTTSPPITVDVSNLVLQSNYYCFRLGTVDPCSNSVTYTNVVCTADFDVAFNNGANRLTWRTSPAATIVSYSRREVVSGITQGVGGIPASPSFYDDVDYECNIEYCYELTVNFGTVQSTSLPQCGVGLKTLTHPAVEDITGSIVNGAAELKYSIHPTLTNFQGIAILRSSDGGVLEAFAITPDTTTYTDATYTTEGAYCYRVNYSDKCLNYSAPGAIVCPVRLFGTINEANVVSLDWTDYQGWKDGVASYTVQKFDVNNVLIQSFPATTETFFVDNQPDITHQIVTYRVLVTPNPTVDPTTATLPAFSNSITITKEVTLTFPTAFTPNADGLNDDFRITGQFVNKMNIRIFDRWGILVFANETNEPWNGTREGLPMPESAYVWKAEITDMAGRTTSREGTLILIRN